MNTPKPYTGKIRYKKGMCYAVVRMDDPKNPTGPRKPIWFSTGLKEDGEKRKANDWLQAKLLELNEQRLTVGQNLTATNDMPLYDYLRIWLRTKRPNIENLTYNGYERIIEGHVKKFFSARNINLLALTDQHIEEFYDSLYDLELSGTTVLNHHRVLFQALKYAAAHSHIMHNPIVLVAAPKPSGFRGSIYNELEADTLLKAASKCYLFIPIILGFFFGMRRSEVCGLRWSSVDFENKLIIVERKLGYKYVNGKKVLNDTHILKSKKSLRSLPFGNMPLVEAALLRAKDLQEEYKEAFGSGHTGNPEGYVVVDELGKLIEPDNLTQSFKRFLASNKLRKIRFHDLRHSCGTLLMKKQVGLYNVSRYLGHSSTAITEAIYIHFDQSFHKPSEAALSKVTSEMSALTKEVYSNLIEDGKAPQNDEMRDVLDTLLTRYTPQELQELLGQMLQKKSA